MANDLPRNGPSGTYSQAWMSRADQSLRTTTPKRCSATPRRPRPATRARVAPPTTKPSSASMSRRTLGPKTGAGSVGALRWPAGPHDVGAGDDDGAGAAVVADRAGASSSAAAARCRGGRSCRRWWRGPRWRRSRRSRRPRSAGAARRRRAARRWGETPSRCTSSVRISVSHVRAAVHAGRPSARKALRLGVCQAVARSGPSPTSPASRPIAATAPASSTRSPMRTPTRRTGSPAVLKAP